jgi:DNA-binding NarL/FixJ family response regulator
MTRLLIAEDHNMVREGLRALIEREADLQVVAEARDGVEAIEKCQESRPDVMLLDLNLPKLHGLHVLSQLSGKKRTKVIVLTMHRDESSILESIRFGASGFLVKDSPASELLAAIRAVAAENGFFVSPEFRPLIQRAALKIFNGKSSAKGDELTTRERTVLELCALSKKNAQIACELGISVRTVEKHRANLMRKLHLRSQSDIILYAVRHDLVQL